MRKKECSWSRSLIHQTQKDIQVKNIYIYILHSSMKRIQGLRTKNHRKPSHYSNLIKFPCEDG